VSTLGVIGATISIGGIIYAVLWLLAALDVRDADAPTVRVCVAGGPGGSSLSDLGGVLVFASASIWVKKFIFASSNPDGALQERQSQASTESLSASPKAFLAACTSGISCVQCSDAKSSRLT
jgi:hypothetical protein